MRLEELEAITFDFGNTLVPVSAADLALVIDRTADWVEEHCPGIGAADFKAAWAEERERQVREEIPQMRGTASRRAVGRRAGRWMEPAR